jgi:hypothetical protein
MSSIGKSGIANPVNPTTVNPQTVESEDLNKKPLLPDGPLPENTSESFNLKPNPAAVGYSVVEHSAVAVGSVVVSSPAAEDLKAAADASSIAVRYLREPDFVVADQTAAPQLLARPLPAAGCGIPAAWYWCWAAQFLVQR